MAVIKIESGNFEAEVLKSDKKVLIDFYADWCGPCQMVSPIVDEIAKEHPEYKVGKINVDDDPQLAISFKVTSIPSLFVMENGKVVANGDGGKTYSNPKGVMYLNANSVCEKVIMDFEAEHLAYGFIENDVTTYTTLEFKGDDLILETRRGDNNALLDSVTINKTIEHNENSFGNIMKRVGYKVIEFAGFVYTMIDNLSRKFN